MFVQMLLLASLFSSYSFASEELSTPEVLKNHEQYGIFTYFPSMPTALFLLDEPIPANHELELRKALNELRQVDTIVLNSPGGDVYSALSMAGVIHDRGLNTYISPKANCASACSFMFLAGKARLAEGQLGVHQFAPNRDSTEKRSQSIALAQFTMSDLYGVLSPFDVPDFVIVKMFDTHPSAMYYFSERQLKNIKKGEISDQLVEAINDVATAHHDFIVRATEDLSLEKSKQDQPVLETTKTETAPSAPGTAYAKTIKQLQAALNSHGCEAGIEDGILGKETRAALEKFAIKTKQPNLANYPPSQQLSIVNSYPSLVCSKPRKTTTIGADGNMRGVWELNSTCDLGKGRLEIPGGVSEGSKFVHKVQYRLSGNRELFSGTLTVWTGSAIEISLHPYTSNSIHTNSIRMTGKINTKRDGFVADVTPHCKTNGSWIGKTLFDI